MIKSLGQIFSKLTESRVVLHSSETCPECGSFLAQDAGADPLNAIWHCPNPDCPAQVRRGLVHWCSPVEMDIAGGDEKLVALLVGRGLVRDVAELYRLRLKELAALPD